MYFTVILLILEAFVKLRIATVIFVMSLCPSVRPHGTTELPLDGFLWIRSLSIFRKSAKKIVQKITGTLHEDLFTVMINSR